MQILLCHSVLGLRDIEREAANLLRGAGHFVSAPDLFGGATAGSIPEGADIVARLGWARVCERAELAVGELQPGAVLAGFSMGVGVVSELWRRRRLSAGAIFLHALPTIPVDVRPAFPFQVHVGANDIEFAALPAIEDLRESSRILGVSGEVFRYTGAGHFFTDRMLPEFDQAAASITWERVSQFLDILSATS